MTNPEFFKTFATSLPILLPPPPPPSSPLPLPAFWPGIGDIRQKKLPGKIDGGEIGGFAGSGIHTGYEKVAGCVVVLAHTLKFTMSCSKSSRRIWVISASFHNATFEHEYDNEKENEACILEKFYVCETIT